MASPAPAGIAPYPGETPEETEAKNRIVSRIKHWEDGIGKDFHRKCERLYKQYRGFTQWEHEWTQAGPNDRDGWVREAHKKWGAKLHIPLSYRTIETVIPRAIANAPKLQALPRDEQWIENVQYVQMMLNAQQEQIDIDLPFQEVMRAGQMYGLGVGKTFWDKKTHMRQRMQPRTIPRPQAMGGSHYLKTEQKVKFDDPRFEDVDVFDFVWSPYAYNMDTCDWTAQRIWMSLEQVLQRLPENGGSWDSEGAKLLNEDEIRKLPGAMQRYDEVWQRRMEGSGFHVRQFTEYGEQIHEVIEYHDGENVFTVLDRKVLVKVCENPCGEMPFQIYRPVPLQHQMVGIGALEPLEHLQRELDTLRSQRRDLVTLALCAGYAYDASSIDPEDLVFGPAAAIEVDGDPRAALMPLGIRDVPGSGFQEELSIRTDIEAVSGMSDALDNSPGGASSTATEAQLVQAALGRRIELGARRFEIEVVRHVACQFLYLDQRQISETRKMAIPGAEPEALDPESARYKWFQIGPGELEGEYEIVVEGGSMAAKNIPQERSDAVALLQNFAHDWFMDPTKPRLEALRKFDVKHPEAWLRSQQPVIPMATLRLMIAQGADPAMLVRAVLKARELEAPEQTHGPVAMSGEGQK